MPTVLQNTEVEESLTKQANEEEQTTTTFNPLEGSLVDDDEGVVADAESEESDGDSDGEPSEEVALPEGDLEEEEADEEGESEDGEDAEEAAEDSEDLSSTLKKATDRVVKARDYSRFSTEDAKYLKQMSNEAFEHFAKRTEETAALQQKLDSTSDKERITADHPDSYILSEDYKEIYGKLSQAQQEQQHWRSQLLKIRNGDAWQNIEGYNDKGQLVMQKDSFKPTQQAEIDVEMALQEAVGLGRKFTDDLNGVSDTHKSSYNDAVTLLEREQNANFAWLTDEKVAKEKIVVPNTGATTIQELKDGFTEALPKTFRKHPMAELASNLFVTLQLQAAHSSSENAKAKEAKRKEPKARRKSSSASADSEDELSVPDWMNL
jgi:hypothetical protein